jgi:hypothetical protein
MKKEAVLYFEFSGAVGNRVSNSPRILFCPLLSLGFSTTTGLFTVNHCD